MTAGAPAGPARLAVLVTAGDGRDPVALVGLGVLVTAGMALL